MAIVKFEGPYDGYNILHENSKLFETIKSDLNRNAI